MEKLNLESIGEGLLFPLFRCLSSEYKQKYKRDIWDQFENNIRSAAYTSKLTKFLENITRYLPIQIQRQYTESILMIIQSGLDEDVLHWLRTETTYMVLVARMKNEERKEDFKQSTLFEDFQDEEIKDNFKF